MPHLTSFSTSLITALATIAYLTCINLIPCLPPQQQTSLPPSGSINSTYTAPMTGCEKPEEVVPDRYQVFLHQGYLLDKHKTFVAKAVDLDSAIRSVLNESASHGLLYNAVLDEHAVLNAVRADVGVGLVSCDVRAYPD